MQQILVPTKYELNMSFEKNKHYKMKVFYYYQQYLKWQNQILPKLIFLDDSNEYFFTVSWPYTYN